MKTWQKKTALAGGLTLAMAGAVTWAQTPASATQPAPSLTTQVVTATAAPFPGGTTATASCPTGTVITGGGFNAGAAAGTAVGESFPNGNAWTAVMTGGPSGQTLTVYAVCGKVS
jgi:hypothetical protein